MPSWLNWGRILRRNPEKNLKSFPPCYSKSPLQLCLEISISSNSRNLLQFLQCATVHCKGERRKTWQKTTPPFLWFKKSQVWELSRLCPETSKKLYVMNSAYVQVADNYDCPVERFFHCTLFKVLLIKCKISPPTEHLPSESAIRWEDFSAFWHHGSPSTYQNR